MSDYALSLASCIVLGLQLALPLLIGGPIMALGLYDDKTPSPNPEKKRRRIFQKARPIVARRDVAALQPLVCAKCRAPVPLLSSSFPCPFCGGPVEPPREYVDALKDRAQATDELARAERLWRWSRVTSSPLLLWPVRVLAVAFSLAVGFACLVLSSGDNSWVPGPVLALAGIVTFFQSAIGLFFIQVFADLRKQLPRVPKKHELAHDVENATCRGCGSPIQFAADRLAVVCNYCEADNYRATLAHARRDEAAVEETNAGQSLLDAARDIHTRRSESMGFAVFLAFAEVFYAVVFSLAALADWIGL